MVDARFARDRSQSSPFYRVGMGGACRVSAISAADVSIAADNRTTRAILPDLVLPSVALPMAPSFYGVTKLGYVFEGSLKRIVFRPNVYPSDTVRPVYSLDIQNVRVGTMCETQRAHL
jgi:hypothetical protein